MLECCSSKESSGCIIVLAVDLLDVSVVEWAIGFESEVPDMLIDSDIIANNQATSF